ncbi:Repeat domain-containing protein, partial [Reichenbachiella agariperforans]
MKQLKVFSFLIAGFVYSSAWSQTFTEQSVTDIEAMTHAQAEWADFDGDGLMDLIVAGTNAGGSSKVVVYINEGSNSFNTVAVANWEDTDFDLGDYNADGYIDILLSGEDASGNKSLKVFKSNAGSSFSEQNFSLASLSRGGVEWFDFDNDGDLDIAASGFDQTGDETFVMYQYHGSSYTLLDTDILPLALGDMVSFDANNDGYEEVLTTGYDALGNSRARIYTILADGTSELYSELSKGYALNTIAVGDMNEDGLLDIVLSGASELSTEDSDLFVNNGTSFTQVSSFLQELSSPVSRFADLNNDGYTDLLLSGLNGSDYYTLYYQNDGPPSYSFSSHSHDLEPIFEGDLALVDYDADGDQDVFQVGNTGFGNIASLFLSDMSASQVDDPPAAPVSEADFGSHADSVWLSWNESTDDWTDQNSLSYNLYVRTEETGNDWVVSPLSDLSTGYRYENNGGNVGLSTSLQLRGLEEGLYYWAVQAVDANNRGSEFSDQESFSICYDVSIGNDTTICRYEALPLLISDAAATEVNWYSKTDGLLQADAFSYTHTVDKKDTLIAEVIKTYGCVRYDTLIVSVYDLPSFNLGNDTTVCYGEYFDLSVSDLGIVGLDSTNWYSTQTGSFLEDSETLSFEVLEKDTLIAEVFNM